MESNGPKPIKKHTVIRHSSRGPGTPQSFRLRAPEIQSAGGGGSRGSGPRRFQLQNAGLLFTELKLSYSFQYIYIVSN